MEYSISISEIFVAVLLLIASGLGFIIREQKEKIKIINSQLSEKKYKLYSEIYSLLFDALKTTKTNKKANPNELGLKIIDIKKDLLIYAPDPIVQKFIEWNRFLANSDGNIMHGKIVLELYILIRKDMGHAKTLIIEEDILRLIMTTDPEVEEFKKMLKL